MSGEPLTDRDTAEAILASAKEQFLTFGFEKATVRGICAGAGVSIGACYYLFPNKEALFAALVEPARNQLEDILAEDRADELLSLLFSHRDGLRLLLERSAGSRYEAWPQRVCDAIEQLLFHYVKTACGAEPDENVTRILADMCFSALKDLVACDCGQGGAVRVANALQTFLEEGLHALSAEPCANG